MLAVIVVHRQGYIEETLLFSSKGEQTELDEKRTCRACLCRYNCSTPALASKWKSTVLLDH